VDYTRNDMMRSVRRLAIVCVFSTVSGWALPARAADMPGPLAALQLGLATATLHAPGNVAVEVKDLATGYETAIHASANMPAASTIKIPVMVEVFRQMELGRFDLNKILHVQPHDRDWGWGDLADARTGTKRTVAQLLRLMITESDNTATNMLIRLVGRTHINQTMQSLGLRNTHLGDDIRSEGDIRSLRSSPSDMVQLLESMARARLIDEWSSHEMLSILQGQHHNGLIPQPLPRGLEIAHKTGTLHDTLNDVGIVYLANEPYIIAVMTTHLPSLDLGRRFIRRVSRLAFASFERFASWRMGEGLPGFRSDAAAAAHPLVPSDAQMWLGGSGTAAPPNAAPASPGGADLPGTGGVPVSPAAPAAPDPPASESP
jgi:beta-lactamase class A